MNTWVTRTPPAGLEKILSIQERNVFGLTSSWRFTRMLLMLSDLYMDRKAQLGFLFLILLKKTSRNLHLLMVSSTDDVLPFGAVVTGAIRAPLTWRGHSCSHALHPSFLCLPCDPWWIRVRACSEYKQTNYPPSLERNKKWENVNEKKQEWSFTVNDHCHPKLADQQGLF